MPKYKVSLSAIKKAVSVSSKIISTNAIIPILECLKIECGQGRMRIVGSDLDVFVESHLDVAGDSDAAVCLPSALFLKLLSSLSSDFEMIIDGCDVTILTNAGEFRIKGEEVSDFPPLPKLDTGLASLASSSSNYWEVKVNSAELMSALDAATFQIHNPNGLNEMLKCVKFEVGADEMKVVAIDGFKMACSNVELMPNSLNQEFVLARKGIKIVQNLLQSQGGFVSLCGIDSPAKTIVFMLGDSIVFSNTQRGVFPNWKGVVRERPFSVQVSKQALLSAIKRVSVMASSLGIVSVSISKEFLEVSAADVEGGKSAGEKVATKGGEASPIAIAFNSSMIEVALNSVDSDDVTLCYEYPNASVNIFGDENSKTYALVMPTVV